MPITWFFFTQGIANIAAISLTIGYPCVASVTHMLINGFKNLLSVAVETNVDFKEASTVKEYLAVSTDSEL